jgi:hypothetical protein
MSNDYARAREADRDAERESQLEGLFAHAEPRLQPPPEHTEEIRRAVLAEWEAIAGRRVWRRRAGFAVAASALLAVVAYVGGRSPDVSAPVVANVERLQGTAESGTGSRLAVGSGVAAGTQVVTRDGQVALRLSSGGSLRIAARSRVVLVGGDEAQLVAGTLYFDSEERRGGAEFSVTTNLGRVRDVGTQFFVQLDGAAQRLDVGVRDGRVVLARSGESSTAAAGERLVATRADAVSREPLATFGAEWAWTETLAPPFDIDGRSIGDFLQWFAAQTGRTVVFADATAERLAREDTLRGSIDLEPLQKLAAVDALTDLSFEVENERVIIRAP